LSLNKEEINEMGL